MEAVTLLIIVFGILGATTRLTRLFVDDQITLPIRRWVVGRFGEEHPLSYLIVCPWCVSPYMATAITLPAIFWGGDMLPWHVRIVLSALLIPTASHVAAYLLTREE